MRERDTFPFDDVVGRSRSGTRRRPAGTDRPSVPLAFEEDGKWVSAESIQTADGSLLHEIGDVLQEPRGVCLGDRAVVELEPGVHIRAYCKRQQGTEVRTRRADAGGSGGQHLSSIGIWQDQGSG